MAQYLTVVRHAENHVTLWVLPLLLLDICTDILLR